MTNAEKYLKDGTDIKEFSRNMFNYLVNRDEPLKIKIENYLQEDVKPTLTEDERVILRNIDKRFYTKIFRNECLFLWGEHTSDLVFTEYDHLFQFIKNGEEYSIEELLKDEN